MHHGPQSKVHVIKEKERKRKKNQPNKQTKKNTSVMLTVTSPLRELRRYPVGRHASTVNETKTFKTSKSLNLAQEELTR